MAPAPLTLSHPPATPRGTALDTASSAAEVRAALEALHEREAALASHLDGLVSSQAQLGRELARLEALRSSLGGQVAATRSIATDMLASAADTAGRLSDRVRSLDVEKSRVEHTLRVVDQVAELKACVHGVVGSMGAPQDWEAAAGYLARAAAAVPADVADSRFAAVVVPSAEVPDAPSATLDAARESLCGLFLREFEAAAERDDGQAVTRFFKLFPLIGRTDVGLDVYGRYVCQGVAGVAREKLREQPGGSGGGGGGGGGGFRKPAKDGFFYANALTALFEHIALIVDRHSALVERHYGAGKMVRVAERLQAEADVQGGIILDSWLDERAFERRLTDVKSYPFSFLVQSFHQLSALPQQQQQQQQQYHGHGQGVPQRTGTPRLSGVGSRTSSPAAGGSVNVRSSEDEGGVDMREVDALLAEMSVMLARWALYKRFMATKCQDPNTPETASLVVPELIHKSNLARKLSSKLTTPYNVMMTFFFRRSVEKAFQLDEAPTGLSLDMARPLGGSGPPYIISAVDVTMYIVSTVLQRTLSTSQRDVVASVVPALGRVLGTDFVGMIQRKMRDEAYPKPAVQGGYPPEDKVVAFVVLINSLELANEYLARVVAGWSPPAAAPPDGTDRPQAQPRPQPPNHHYKQLQESFPFEGELAFVTAALRNLQASFVAKTTELLNEGIQVLFNQVVKLRLRTVLSETFRNVDYSLDEDEHVAQMRYASSPDGSLDDSADASYHDLVARRFEHGWDQVARPLARLMAPRPYGQLTDTAALHLSRVLEKRLWSQVGRASAHGAVRLERDFGGVVAVVARGNWAVREMFARVLQVLMVVNLEEDEWEEMVLAAGDEEVDREEGMGVDWVLTEDERRKARAIVRA